jgi:hypothetical protein
VPFYRVGGRRRRPGGASGGGNWHLQWKCDLVKGVMRGPTSRLNSMVREVGGGRHGAAVREGDGDET